MKCVYSEAFGVRCKSERKTKLRNETRGRIANISHDSNIVSVVMPLFNVLENKENIRKKKGGEKKQHQHKH